MQIKIAPSLGEGFAGTPQECWGVTEYTDTNKPCVFMGLYGLPDFFNLWRHKGKKYIFWCGSDVQHFLNGYWLDEEGKMRIHPIQLSSWIDTYCESYVENEVEQQALRTVGIRSKVVPSFLGNVNDYKIEYKPKERPSVYTSISGDNWKLYGWDRVGDLALENPDIDFHLYGNTKPYPFIEGDNVIVHGRVSQEQMNKEIKNMQGALRLTEFDGCSELIAKSLLWGQYPISIIEYPTTQKPEWFQFPEEPNKKGREWFLSAVNKYPWNTNI